MTDSPHINDLNDPARGRSGKPHFLPGAMATTLSLQSQFTRNGPLQ
ncbi:MAG: hypothetical protein V9H25_16275 [Candidatus Competibacter sp.]|jgi:hypothetical protein